MKLNVFGRMNASNIEDKKISYYNYVKRLSSVKGFPLRTPIKVFSFQSILNNIGNRISAYIKNNKYIGGNKRKIYKSKTYKKKKKYNK